MQINDMYTPQGLKIRLDKDFCEQLEFKDKSLYDLLKQIELFNSTPRWVFFVGGSFAFIDRLQSNRLLIVAFIITFIISLSSWLYPIFMLVKNILTISQPYFFVKLSGWFIDKIILLIIGLFTVGWKGILFYFGGYYLAIFLGFLINLFLMKSNYTQYGIAIQSDENAFIYLMLGQLKKVSYMDFMKAYYEYLNSNE